MPDNPKAMIADADRYEPRATDTVLDCARHYGTSVLPARARRPQDKARVEFAVQLVERWVLARLRHQRFASVEEVDRALVPLMHRLNHKPFQKMPGTRATAFAALDAPALGPLPVQRYEIARFKTVKVHIDYHVKRYTRARLEAACTVALSIGACRYRHVRDILASNRDRAPAGETQTDWISPAHAHVRGPGYYQ